MIWNHFSGSLALFVTSTFIIPALILFLVAIIRSDIKDEPSAQPPTPCSNSDTTLSTDHDDTLSNISHISNKSRRLKWQLTSSLQWVASTILLASAASLSAFQIILVLFTRYCLGVYMSDVVSMCIAAAVGALVVLLGGLAWLIITLRLAEDCVFWCRSIIRRAAKRGGKSGPRDMRNSTRLHELQRNDEHVIEEERIQSPAPTLPPYMA
jgi:hypothetical protein